MHKNSPFRGYFCYEPTVAIRYKNGGLIPPALFYHTIFGGKTKYQILRQMP